jgi:hypothetical protein
MRLIFLFSSVSCVLQCQQKSQNPRLILRRVVLDAASGKRVGPDDQFAIEPALTLRAGRTIHQKYGIAGPPRA